MMMVIVMPMIAMQLSEENRVFGILKETTTQKTASLVDPDLKGREREKKTVSSADELYAS